MRLLRLLDRAIKTSVAVGSKPLGVEGARNQLRGRKRGGPLVEAVGGKVVVITGASSGIGREAALQLAAAGAHVLLVARDLDRLDAVRSAIEDGGGVAFRYSCDLADLDATDALADRILREHGHVDVLINNAGRSIRRRVELSYDRFHDFERPMTLNYFAAIRLTLSLLPSMRERRDGHVINISSMAVQARPPRFSGYVASKAALEAWSDSVQAEIIGEGVRFTNVRMPLVRTPMIAPTAAFRHAPALTPEQAGRVVATAVIRRPRRLGPLGGYVIAGISAAAPRFGDAMRGYGDRFGAGLPRRPLPRPTLAVPEAQDASAEPARCNPH